jgi:hypothetical protein
MPQAIHTHTTGCVVAPSRRQLGGASLAALCGAAFGAAVVLPDPGEAFPAPANRDAELIRLCAECDALQSQVDALWADRMTHLPNAEQIALEHARDAKQQPLLEQMDPLLERICEMRATTPQGHAARARTLLQWDKNPIWTHDECWNSQLLGAIVRDLVGAA